MKGDWQVSFYDEGAQTRAFELEEARQKTLRQHHEDWLRVQDRTHESWVEVNERAVAAWERMAAALEVISGKEEPS